MIRKAYIRDAKAIQALINYYAHRDLMLPRSLNDIYESIRDFHVYIEKDRIVGCSALHIVGWENLAEIRSLAVLKQKQNKDIGTMLLESIFKEAKILGVKKLFALTYQPKFFKKFKFKMISKKNLPHKIWAECCHCPKFPKCDEVALIKNL